MSIDWMNFMETLQYAVAVGVPIGLVCAAAVEVVKKLLGLFGFYLPGPLTGAMAMAGAAVLTLLALMDPAQCGASTMDALFVTVVACWTPKLAYDAVRRNEG